VRRVFVAPTLNPAVADLFADPSGLGLPGDVEVVSGAGMSADERRAAVAGAVAFFGVPTDADLAAGGALEVIAFPGSGTDLFDVAKATAQGIAVVNAAGSQYKAVAEHAIGLLLALAKRIAIADRWFHDERRFPPRDRFTGQGWPHGFPVELDGRTLGVVGFGFVGRDLAEKCRLAFGMRVLAYDPFYDRVEAERQHVTLVDDLHELLRGADVVSLHLPLLPSTHGLIGEAELRVMRPNAFLLNLARGGIVDEGALVRALQEGWIAGAGVDVFDPEPPPDDSPLFALDNAVLTAHVGGWTAESLPRLALLAAQEMVEVLHGRRSHRLVNPDVWDRRRTSAP
jgi:D-3-phosphoglycerate dehydrogenase